MSVLGYDPKVYYRGRSAIEAHGMGVPVDEGETDFRCNLVGVRNGTMWSYSSGHISTSEGQHLIATLNDRLGSDNVRFYPGVGYRHLCKIEGREDTLLARCTPPHDIPEKAIAGFLPQGPGSDLLRELMASSELVLRDHPVNLERRARGDIPATMIWLFWGSGKIPAIPAFREVYGLDAAVISAVDIVRGLARMTGLAVLDVPGVTGDMNNDYVSQGMGTLEALEKYDMAVVHVEATDEAAHAGLIKDKIEGVQQVDEQIVSRLRSWDEDSLRVLILPDHATPVETQTHVDDAVPFVLWGPGFEPSAAKRFTEAEAKGTGVLIEQGFDIMRRLIE
jgi:2,3-bisphosphoglycerate-independent phosphoglycerate mutase